MVEIYDFIDGHRDEPQGAGRTHHVHFFEPQRFEEHTRFRDALRNDSKLAQEYQKLKLELAEKFRHNREAYTEAKAVFIQRVLKKDFIC